MAERAQQEVPPTRRNWAGPVAEDAGDVAGRAFGRAGFQDPSLVLRWAEIVGDEVARIARPLKLSTDSGGGVLTLMAEPAASVFLEHETRTLCARINAFLGKPAVSRLRFVFQSLTDASPSRPAPTFSVNPADDDPARQFEGPAELKAALLGLAGARAAREANRDN